MIKTMGSFVTYVPQDDRRSVILSREAAKNPREPVILSEAKDLMDDYEE